MFSCVIETIWACTAGCALQVADPVLNAGLQHLAGYVGLGGSMEGVLGQRCQQNVMWSISMMLQMSLCFPFLKNASHK